ncbi:MAG: NAD-dependent epimerase/dehydratase family protein [Candidatus Aenigmatarchaeota archaeon]
MILVTGASGRVGRHLVRALVKREEHVRVLVRSEEKAKGLVGVEVYEGDILDKESLKRACEGVDTVYHLAALVRYDVPEDELQKVNVEGTKNVVEAYGGRKIIYLSSTAAMGKKLAEIPANESTECRPTDYYGKTKLEAEKIVLDAGGIVVRAADVYGKDFHEGYFDVFEMLEKGKMHVLGKGKNRIQYVHVDDLVLGLIVAENLGKAGEVYIITGPEVKTQEELYGLICRKLGVEPPKKHVPVMLAKTAASLQGKEKWIPFIEKIAADRVFDISKAKKELGFEPKVGYEEGIAEMIVEYRKEKAKEKVRQAQQEKQEAQQTSQFSSFSESE